MVPAIYVRNRPARPLPWAGRLLAVAITLAALCVLLAAAWITPNPSGMNTHEQLGMQPCDFLRRTGYPCAGCGMTTSFSYFVRGQWLTSAFTQPFGFVLAFLAAMTFWVAAYCGVTGRAAYRLLKIIPPIVHLWLWIPLAFAAWGWKIAWVVAAR